MLPLDQNRWLTYKAAVALRTLFEQNATEEVWQELWDELHHQGDISAASYAAVPYLLEYARKSAKLDWNVFGLISTIEERRPYNLPVPAEIAPNYFGAIIELPQAVALHPGQDWDDVLTQCVVSCIAFARGQRTLGRAYREMNLDAATKWLAEEVGFEEGWEADADPYEGIASLEDLLSGITSKKPHNDGEIVRALSEQPESNAEQTVSPFCHEYLS